MEKQIPIYFDSVIIDSPFQEISQTTPNIGRLKVRVFTKYGNRNGSYITEAVAEQLINSACSGSTPVVGFFDPETQTWAGHTGPTLANGYGYVKSFEGWQPLQDTDGVVRDYVPVQNSSDDKYCLYDKVTGRILAAGGTTSLGGGAADIDFSQRGRTVTLATELDDGALPKGPISLAFNGNQLVQGTLYAAYDNAFAGTDVAAWAKAVELGKVKNGVQTMTVTLPKNSEHYSRVKFFVRDNLGDDVSQTQSFGTGIKGLMIIVL